MSYLDKLAAGIERKRSSNGYPTRSSFWNLIMVLFAEPFGLHLGEHCKEVLNFVEIGDVLPV